MAQHYTHTEDYIKSFYEKIGITKPQELKFQTIAEKSGVYVFYWPEPSQALFADNQNYILLNEKLTPQQQLPEFTHELAHVLFHAGNQSKIPDSFREYQESRANIFMYHATIPTFMLNDLNINDCTKESIRLVQQLFHVEEDFAMKRLSHYMQRKQSILNWNTFRTSL